MTSSTADHESTEYHDRCLPLVIEALSGTYDEDLLDTVLLLRIHEEYSNLEDSMHHLVGANQLLNSFTACALPGSLGEAASWQALRQVIYACVDQWKPLEVSLDGYEFLAQAGRFDDDNHANSSVLMCAKVLQIAYGLKPALDPQLKAELDTEADAWLTNRPTAFVPLTHQITNDRDSFPHIPMLSPAGDGYLLINPGQRAQAIDFLIRMRSVVAWNADPIIRLLREQWKELSR
ncbi:hypothetical protein B9Z65_8237 [Elsinoe australis]|uniref:Uncharacterized protein n=1 Tax=Elsinoe australis TaxID=40998 RepID=A0A2P7ZMM9_9PEZI|nr:hypothetical protein B9Z65_8237 [Elsinoe australis]